MRVQLAYPQATPQQIEAHFRSVFPRYSVVSRAGSVIVGDGAATGVLLKRSGTSDVTLVWAFPSMAVQMILTLAIVLTGILPGLILFGITWMVVSSGVARLKQEVATVLQGGAPPAQTAQNALPAADAPTSPPSPLGLAASIVAFVIALFSLIGPGRGAGLFSALFWVAAGAGGCMLYFDQKRAFETRSAAKSAGRIVLAVAAILNGLLAFFHAIDTSSDFYLARGLFSAVFYLGAAVILVLLHTGKLQAESAQWTSFVAGGVVVIFGLLGFYDLFDILDRVDFDFFTLTIAVRSLAWIALGGLLVARGLTSKPAPLPQAVAV
jgi:hypothetical protein